MAAGFLLPLTAQAHGGGLDGLGCHHNRKAGGYHCHRGPMAGQQFGSKAEAQRGRESSSRPPHTPPASATTPTPKTGSATGYHAVILSVYDGDTFTAQVRIWPGHTVKERVRVANIDAPEIKGKCASENELAIRARDFARRFLGKEANLTLGWDRPRDRYGRILATVADIKGEDLGEALIRAGLARRWTGRRRSWC